MRRRLQPWLPALIAALALVPAAVQARPVIRELARAGSWSVVAQAPAAQAAAAACMIVEPAAAVAIRSAGQRVDLMVANAHWDLPKALRGAIRLGIGPRSLAWPATSATADTAIAPIDPAAVPALLDALAGARSITVTLFPGMPIFVPPEGFAAVLPAFRRCAGLR